MPFQKMTKGAQGGNSSDEAKCYASMQVKAKQRNQFSLRIGQSVMNRAGFRVDQPVEVLFDPVTYEMQVCAPEATDPANLMIRKNGRRVGTAGGRIRATIRDTSSPYYGVRDAFGQIEAPLVAVEPGMIHLRLPSHVNR